MGIRAHVQAVVTRVQVCTEGERTSCPACTVADLEAEIALSAAQRSVDSRVQPKSLGATPLMSDSLSTVFVAFASHKDRS